MDGFFIAPPPYSANRLTRIAAAYDSAVENANPADVRIGSSSTRVNGFVSRGEDFDELYLQPLLLEACRFLLGERFKLSTMHAWTLRPNSAEQKLHVDCDRDAMGWTLVGFIFMVDEFRADNGATRLIPGSHVNSAALSEIQRAERPV